MKGYFLLLMRGALILILWHCQRVIENQTRHMRSSADIAPGQKHLNLMQNSWFLQGCAGVSPDFVR